MSKITGDEPATGYGFANGESHESHSGLTIRQQFAMAAMQGIMGLHNIIDPKKLANASVRCADALIEELNKKYE